MISNIQILRAIAAILVVAFHTVPTAKSYQLSTDFFYKVDSWGSAGVDIFFVISGFIMVYIQTNKNKSPINFLKDRIERIVPLYWFLTLSFSSLLFTFPHVFNVWSFDLNTLINSLFFMNYLTSGNYPVLFVGWTLEYEMLFYVIFGLSLFLNNINYSIFFSILSLIIMVYLGLSNIVIEFCYGMLVALLYNNLKIKINSLVCLIFIILGFYSLTIDWKVEIPRFIAWGLPSLLIFLGFLYLNPIKSKLLDTLGSASYSIYLVHVFSVLVSYRIFSKIGQVNFNYINEIYVILSILLSVLAGVLIHFIVEKPLARVIKKMKLTNRNNKLDLENT